MDDDGSDSEWVLLESSRATHRSLKPQRAAAAQKSVKLPLNFSKAAEPPQSCQAAPQLCQGHGTTLPKLPLNFAKVAEPWTLVDRTRLVPAVTSVASASAGYDQVEQMSSRMQGAQQETPAAVEVVQLSPRAETGVDVDAGWRLASKNNVASEENSQEQENAVEAHPLPPLSPSLSAMVMTSTYQACTYDASTDFVVIDRTPTTLMRSLQRIRPATASSILRVWFVILLLGELATTLWWIYSLGATGFAFFVISASLAVAMSLCMLSFEQVLATMMSLGLSALPALPAYSAILLLVPPEVEACNCSCWDMLNLPTLVALATINITAAILAVRSQGKAPSNKQMIAALQVLQEIARGACILAMWGYLAVLINVGAIHLQGSEESVTWKVFGGVFAGGPWMTGRGLVLCLHAIGLCCAELRHKTSAALGAELLPTLLGAERARNIFQQRWQCLWRYMRNLKRWAPPKAVLALILGFRRTALILLPGLALLAWLRRDGLQTAWICLCAALALLATLAAVAEWHQGLPKSAVRRLPLLLPPHIVPVPRKVMGYALAVAEGLSRSSARVRSLRMLPVRVHNLLTKRRRQKQC